MKIDEFIQILTPNLSRFSIPKVALGQCDNVSTAICFVAKYYHLKVSIGSIGTTYGIGHYFNVIGDEIIDFTYNQFHMVNFPVYTKIGSRLFKNLYDANGYFSVFDHCDVPSRKQMRLINTIIKPQRSKNEQIKPKCPPLSIYGSRRSGCHITRQS